MKASLRRRDRKRAERKLRNKPYTRGDFGQDAMEPIDWMMGIPHFQPLAFSLLRMASKHRVARSAK